MLCAVGDGWVIVTIYEQLVRIPERETSWLKNGAKLHKFLYKMVYIIFRNVVLYLLREN